MNTSRARQDSTRGALDAEFDAEVTMLRAQANVTDDAADVDRVYDGLSNRRRRQILRLLDGREDSTANLTELATIIAAWENDIDDPEQVTYDDRKSVQVAIYQHHAPKMDDAELIDYDKRVGELRLDCDVPSLLSSMEIEEDTVHDARRRYVLFAALVALGTSAVHFAFPDLANWTLLVALVVVLGASLSAVRSFE